MAEPPSDLSPDPVLAATLDAMNEAGHWAEIVDDRWRWVAISDELQRSYSGLRDTVDYPVGAFYFGPEAAAARLAMRSGPTTSEISRRQFTGFGPWTLADLGGDRDALRAAVDEHLTDLVDGLGEDDGLPVRTLAQRGTGVTGLGEMAVPITGLRIRRADGRLAGTCLLFKPGVGMSAMATLTGHHDRRHVEHFGRVARPARRPSAILFADLEASSPLARRLPTATYFRVSRQIVRAADRSVIDAGGLPGRHVGDGVVAFFPADLAGSESAAARGCIEAARTLRAGMSEVAAATDLATEDLTLRFGLHWGSTLFVGGIVTPGRSEVTALGDEVNETARIEACASGGRALASKALIERLEPADAAVVGVDARTATYTALGELPSATEKARRDAPAIAVCEI